LIGQLKHEVAGEPPGIPAYSLHQGARCDSVQTRQVRIQQHGDSTNRVDAAFQGFETGDGLGHPAKSHPSCTLHQLGKLARSASYAHNLSSRSLNTLALQLVITRISNCEFGADGYVYMTSNTRLIRAKVKVKKIERKGA
jgi:hypothetical protein